jgi:hypothetical protein
MLAGIANIVLFGACTVEPRLLQAVRKRKMPSSGEADGIEADRPAWLPGRPFFY